LLETILEENDLLSHPERIYSMDESGIPLDPKPPCVVSAKNVKGQIPLFW